VIQIWWNNLYMVIEYSESSLIQTLANPNREIDCYIVKSVCSIRVVD